MTDWLLENEPQLRLGSSIGLLLLFAGWEQLASIRPRAVPLWRRRIRNLVVAGLNGVLVRLFFIAATTSTVALAWFAQDQGVGFFNLVNWPYALEFLLGLLLLDVLIYGQHVVFHKVPFLWRVHRVHHMDTDLDVTSGLRFHPVEILLSMGIKFAAILALGVPALAVLVFEVVLNATSMFNHSNINLPSRVDRLVRLVLVTPAMHWVHHSVHRNETDSNYGFNLPWWDRLFGTYRAAPKDGYAGMTIGLPLYRLEKEQSLMSLLANPFQKRVP